MGLLAYLASPTEDGARVGKVIKVPEGDRLVLSLPDGEKQVYLAGIDSPEPGQPGFQEAERETARLTEKETVTLRLKSGFEEGFQLAEVFLPDGRVLNRELVKEGWAWWIPVYKGDRTLSMLERQARKRGIGIWGERNPMPPWEYRGKLEMAIPTPTPEAVPEEVMREVGSRTNRYIGDPKTKLYYSPRCPDYEAVSGRENVIFSGPYEAQAAGYRKGRGCP